MYALSNQRHSLKTLKDFTVITSVLGVKMNTAELNVYKKVLQEVCKNFIRAEEFVIDKIEEICCDEKLLSVEEVNLFKIAIAFKAKLVTVSKIVFKKQ